MKTFSLSGLAIVFGFLFYLGCPSPLAAQATQDTLYLQLEEGIAELQLHYRRQNLRNPHIPGYRIQIYNGRKNACQAKRSAFVQLYPDLPPYTLYESPEYRVQVGNFRSRLEAERLLTKIIVDFPGSFILKTWIDWPALPAQSIKP